MSEQMSETDFERRVERAIKDLEQSFADLADDREIDVEVEGGVLTITFEEGEPGKFIVSPNSSVRQVWVSARVSSFKFNWSESSDRFELAGTGEPLKEVMTRLTRDQLGDQSVSL